ncbi:hypothetical protein Sjap_011707 [Stephania japonica]|uniref:Uncharacterized protein n=1 Tax=Stephania japonica TaxID=461633 RepID=A0AAP0JDW4_9MAGN
MFAIRGTSPSPTTTITTTKQQQQQQQQQQQEVTDAEIIRRVASQQFPNPCGLPSLQFFFPKGEPLLLLLKRTYQPSTIKWTRTHGFFARYVNEVAVAFPPYRKSPLKSKMLEIFVRILSLYDDKSPLDDQDTEEGEILDAASVPYLVETVDSLSNFTEELAKAGAKEVNGSNGRCNFLLNDPIASSPSREFKVAMESSENTSTELRDRKKRAEKNRQQGVKTLKLQPITKPKPIKSIECSNLASTSCQKEPEPSSLQNNMSSQTSKTVKETSAKMPLIDAALKTKEQTSKGSDIIGKRQLNNSSPSLQIVKKIRKTTSSVPYSIDNPIQRCQSKYVTNLGLRQPPTQAPKGISFLSFGKPLSNDTDKQVQRSSPSERDEGSEMHSGNNQNESEKFGNANETLCGTPASPFLPFCQAPTFATAEKTRNSKGLPWKTPASKVSFGESPSAELESQKKITSTASSAEKALLSTMAFASKYQAEMIGKSTQIAVSNYLNNGTKVGNLSSSGRIQKECF